MRFIYMVLLGGLLGLTSCNGAGTNTGSASTTNTQAKPKEPAHSKLNDSGTQLLMVMVNKYYGLKNALVATKSAKADSAATELTAAADSLKAFLKNNYSKDDTVTVYDKLHSYLDTIIAQSEAVHNIKDETCERQRILFDVISRDVYAMLKNVELKNGGIYHEYCPMAFNERGAYWLSDDADIKNPYFGKKMLECGEVTDSL